MTTDALTLITTVDELRYYLKEAMKLEHATIPPYITALYTARTGNEFRGFSYYPPGCCRRNATSHYEWLMFLMRWEVTFREH